MINKWIYNFYNSLVGRLLLSIFIAQLVLTPLLYFTLVTTYQTSANKQFVARARDTMSITADALYGKSITSNKSIGFELLDSLLLSNEVTYVDIYLNNTIILPAALEKSPANHFKEDKTIGQHTGNIYFLSMPLYLSSSANSRPLLRMGFDETLLLEEYNSIKARVIILLFSYFFISLGLVASISIYILSPLKELRSRSKKIAMGNLSMPMHVSSTLTEVNQLSIDLEQMRHSLVDLAGHMEHRALHDDLTSIPNRALLHDRLEQAVSKAQRETTSFSVLLLDLNNFKDINDTLGHAAGDDVLRLVSRRLTQLVRNTDTLARLGGDEFCLIYYGIREHQAERLAANVYNVISKPIIIEDNTLKITTSIGIATYPDHGKLPGDLLKHADVAMYNAKRNQLTVSCYTPGLDQDNFEQLTLAFDLKQCLKKDQLVSLFHPKVDLKTNKPCGVELLLRWNHPDLGTISPEKFIPLAERDRFITDITMWLIGHHLEDCYQLLKLYPQLKFSINVSPNDLDDDALLLYIEKTLKAQNFPAENLIIETTESAVMKNPTHSEKILNKFSDYGVKISIDDFGTGYSSMSYVQNFPVDELKIDRLFIEGLMENSKNMSIVSGTIALAHELNLTVVAEGVENKETLELVKSMDCDAAQGFYFAEPMTMDELKKWLKSY
ncbi:MAG: EAL domain-containing protein [Gammaproteobacteria bacterium]|nr:EAL domain-containing protein [Gammaproteobacteria bacterium]